MATKATTKKPVAKAPVKKVATKATAKTPTRATATKTASRASAKPAARPARKPLPIWKAPEDFKPHFVEVVVQTEKDGLLGAGIRAIRFNGRYDPKADEKKKFDMSAYDPATVRGILARFSAVTFATNPLKRLPANTKFVVVLRVNRKSADGSLSVLCKGISQVQKVVKKGVATGRVAAVALEKSDVNYRKLRKAMRIMPVAFKEVLMPPKRVRGANQKVDSDD